MRSPSKRLRDHRFIALQSISSNSPNSSIHHQAETPSWIMLSNRLAYRWRLSLQAPHRPASTMLHPFSLLGSRALSSSTTYSTNPNSRPLTHLLRVDISPLETTSPITHTSSSSRPTSSRCNLYRPMRGRTLLLSLGLPLPTGSPKFSRTKNNFDYSCSLG